MGHNARSKKRVNRAISIGEDTYVDKSASLHGKIRIGRRCFIGKHVVIGQASIEEIEENLGKAAGKALNELNVKTTIGDDVIIQPNVLISSGISIGNHVKIGPFVTIGKNSKIDNGTHIMYSSQIHENVRVGKGCKIGGFLCDFSNVGDSTYIWGSLIHDFRNLWDEEQDLAAVSPTIEGNVVVGWGALVIGKVRIKSGTFIAAGAIVTKDTPGNCVVTGVNNVKCIEKYKGKLKRSKIFQEL